MQEIAISCNDFGPAAIETALGYPHLDLGNGRTQSPG